MFSAPPATTTVPAWIVSAADLDAGRAAALDHDAVDGRVRAQLEQPARPGVGDLGVLESFLPAFVGQPWRHEPQCMQLPSVYDMTGSSSCPSALHPALDRVHARLPVAALADAEAFLDAS